MWSSLARKAPADAAAQVRELADALKQADLPQLGTLALTHLGSPAGTGDEAVRRAAREELFARAQGGDPLATESLLTLKLDDSEVAAHAELAVKLARAHLERALLARPLLEGGSFEAGQDPAALPPAEPAALVPPAAAQVAQQKAFASELAEVGRLAQAVPPRNGRAGEAHELAGLAALAAGDELSAEKEFSALAVEQRGAPGRSEKALLQLARLAYGRGDDARAERLYARVGRGSAEWLDALFEASWAHFRQGQDEKVLGNLLTLQSPFFLGREFPEGYVLQALVLFENCRYADARRALAKLEQGFRPRHDGLAEASKALDALPQPYEALGMQRAMLEQGLSATARAELERAATEPSLQADRMAVTAMAVELDSFDRRPELAGTLLARTLLPELRARRLALLESAGRRLRAHLDTDRAELRELLGQSLRLSYEISGRERDQATDPSARAQPRPQATPDLDDDEVLWPFQGEYWRDELGAYRFQLGTRCTPAPRFRSKTQSASMAH